MRIRLMGRICASGGVSVVSRSGLARLLPHERRVRPCAGDRAAGTARTYRRQAPERDSIDSSVGHLQLADVTVDLAHDLLQLLGVSALFGLGLEKAWQERHAPDSSVLDPMQNM